MRIREESVDIQRSVEQRSEGGAIAQHGNRQKTETRSLCSRMHDADEVWVVA